MNWSRRSSMNYAATHQLCSIPLSCSEKHTSQPLLMSSGFFLDVQADVPNEDSRYVLDGGALVQRIPWIRGSTYGCIVNQYTEYVTHKYRDAVVVFDGYDNANTKDMTHQRRSKGNAGTTVTFTGDTPVTMKKDQYLANRQDKKRFISMLSEELAKKNCETHHASGYADLHIVQKVVQSATSCNTVLVGDDTYLLVLLCYHAS